VQGADPAAQEIGLKPVLSGVKTEDEGLYTEQHRYWLETMQRAVKAEQARAARAEEGACDHSDHSCTHRA
jgi:benzoate/toluate 1,2-dioxygenase alpha subunit